MQLPDIARGVGPRSRRSLFRDLTALGYRSSYTHTGRYYTLVSVPTFDADGLWRYQGIGFSRDGTLKAKVQRLVETSDAGRTHNELHLRLGVRVHNLLLVSSRPRSSAARVDRERVRVRRRSGAGDGAAWASPALVTAGGAPPTAAIEVEC
jgi:hypothetical protein